MFNDLKLAFSTLRQPFVLCVLAFSLAATLAIFMGLARLASWAITQGSLFGSAWAQLLAGYTGGFFVLVLGWFLFPLVMTAIACLFLEPLARQIERQHYPELPAARATDWADATILTLRTLWRVAIYNLIALPLYIIPVLNIAVYVLVNAKLLAHEYYYALALRHLPLAAADNIYAQSRLYLFKTGLQLAFFFLIPGLNLLAPILATSLMLHRLESRPNGLLRQTLAT